MRHFREIALVIGVLANARLGVASDETSLETNFAASMIASIHDPPPAAAPAPGFGTKDTWRWMLQTGVGFDPKSSTDEFGLLGGGVSYFMIDDLSIDLELNGMYFKQSGDDAVGINFTLLFRWHFVAEETWSLFLDIGVGLMGTTAKVPQPTTEEPRGGSSFNFTPQAGAGFTIQITENTRFIGGVRMYHISNAQIYEGNPGRDSIYIYGGVSFPF